MSAARRLQSLELAPEVCHHLFRVVKTGAALAPAPAASGPSLPALLAPQDLLVRISASAAARVHGVEMMNNDNYDTATGDYEESTKSEKLF